jgi:hypothetical protein
LTGDLLWGIVWDDFCSVFEGENMNNQVSLGGAAFRGAASFALFGTALLHGVGIQSRAGYLKIDIGDLPVATGSIGVIAPVALSILGYCIILPCLPWGKKHYPGR